jgi:UDPglucose 6-dehydrogenase
LRVAAMASAMEAVRGADAVMVMTPWPEFRTLIPAEVAAAMRGRILVDPFRIFEATAARHAGLQYFTLGVTATEEKN